MQKHYRQVDINLTDKENNYSDPSNSLNNRPVGKQPNMRKGVYRQAAIWACEKRQIAFITATQQLIPFWNPWGQGSERDMFYRCFNCYIKKNHQEID